MKAAGDATAALTFGTVTDIDDDKGAGVQQSDTIGSFNFLKARAGIGRHLCRRQLKNGHARQRVGI